ncbi:hypothetical protein ONS95_010730 [Cadophora gregata]|uniref:uncharacterized protein n=1 Tax=Cadophora gregata TaxID=51156 RepID=UPI0026DCAA83|nr:uncharacterized protein ONS95_010730 [Cadophora gregata]KAK0122500.1 hypothetical protein ONS95_010730 [Cadophora gregata]
MYVQDRYSQSGLHDDCRLILPIHNDPGVSGRHMRRDKIDVSLIRQWLDTCDELHAPCKNQVDDLVPEMKVIDCLSRTIVPYTSPEDGYIALSYVWGSEPPTLNFQGNVLDSLPKVVEDAVALVQQIGVRYLWVDRYCIPQHDASVKALQIQNMGRIYGGSTLTIIAAAGESPHYGLPGVSSTLKTPQPEIRVDNYCLAGFLPPRKEVKKSMWNSRGWTYQEGILSKRRLVFTESQVLFQCLGSHCSDSISVPFRALHSKRSVFFESVDFGYFFPSAIQLKNTSSVLSQIERYRYRNLSVDADALDAIAGVFKMYGSTKQPVRFLCGLHIFSKELLRTESNTDILVKALSWLACESLVRRPHFPSWSWVGWKNFTSAASTARLRLAAYPYTFQFKLSETHHDPRKFAHIEVKAELENGQILKWESSHHQILDICTMGKYPTHLRISGWGFRGQIIRDRTSGWRFASPTAYINTRYSVHLPDLGFCEEDSATLDIIAILVATSRRSFIDCLIFRILEGANVLERIRYDRRSLTDDDTCEFLVHPDEKRASFGNLQLEWTEIRVA